MLRSIKYVSDNLQKPPFEIFTTGQQKEYRLKGFQGAGLESVNNIATSAGYDGGKFISSALPIRNITLTFDIIKGGDVSNEIDLIYDIFSFDTPGTLYYITDNGTKKIKTYISSVDINHFIKQVTATIVFECPLPFWETEEKIEYMATTLDNFTFPFEVENFELLQNSELTSLEGWQLSNNNFKFTSGSVSLKANRGIELFQDIQPINMKLGDSFKIEIEAEKADFKFKVVTIAYSDTEEIITEIASNDITLEKANIIVPITQVMLDATFIRFIAGSSDSSINCIINRISVHTGGNLEFGKLNATLLSHIYNAGQKETGAVFEIKANGTVTDPKITDTDTGKKMEVNIDLIAGDKLIISTLQGDKTLTHIRNGISTNVFNLITSEFDFLQLHQGTTNLLYDAASNAGNMAISVQFTEKYGGV